MTQLSIAILGCGPAGLAAAHAVHIATRILAPHPSLTILSNYMHPSTLYGAQYLHEPIPGMGPDPDPPLDLIKYELQGSALNYREKVYGPDYTGAVSPEDLPEEHYAWDLRLAYQNLWERYWEFIQYYQVAPSHMPRLLETFDLIISSIPARRICAAGHEFRSQTIYAAGEAPDLGITLPYECPDMTVRCNGLPEPAWYRISNIFGRKTVEWPEAVVPPVESAVRVDKPLSTNCICWEGDRLLRVGRYGRWEKGVLVHDAFNVAYDWMRERV